MIVGMDKQHDQIDTLQSLVLLPLLPSSNRIKSITKTKNIIDTSQRKDDAS